MRVSDADADARLADAVLAYLAEHPDAMDTVDGVAEWWVMRQRVRGDVEAVARVLHALAERGVLEEIGEGAGRRYRLRR
jgi:hypothetical protein